MLALPISLFDPLGLELAFVPAAEPSRGPCAASAPPSWPGTAWAIAGSAAKSTPITASALNLLMNVMVVLSSPSEDGVARLEPCAVPQLKRVTRGKAVALYRELTRKLG